MLCTVKYAGNCPEVKNGKGSAFRTADRAASARLQAGLLRKMYENSWKDLHFLIFCGKLS